MLAQSLLKLCPLAPIRTLLARTELGHCKTSLPLDSINSNLVEVFLLKCETIFQSI